MKTHHVVNPFSTTLALIAILIFVTSCAKDEVSPLDDRREGVGLKSAIELTDPVQLEGYTRFAIYSVGEHRYLTTGYEFNFLWCEAELVPTGKHSFTLNTTEYFVGDPNPYRIGSMEGHISTGGQFRFTWYGAPSDIQLHTGVTPHGPAINEGAIEYFGSFDGTSFNAEMHVSGLQTQPAAFPFFWASPDDPSELFKGPLQLTFMFQLELAE